MAAIKIFISSVQKEFSEERKALVRFLEEKEYLRLLPWDATMSNDATIADLDEKKISDFVALARTKRGFKLDYTGDNTLDILIALNLATEAGRITNAALLLFAKNPQRYFVSSVVKCMVFPTGIMTKPILSHQVYQGTLFDLVDAAKGFVMQHIDAKVGTEHRIRAGNALQGQTRSMEPGHSSLWYDYRLAFRSPQ